MYIRQKRWVFLPMILLAALLLSGSAWAAERVFTNSLGMKFVLIPAGEFVMGCAVPGCGRKRRVSVAKPFYLGQHEVTQAQWQAVMGKNPSTHQGPDRPVNQVSWLDAQNFVRQLNAKEGHNRYRLPTEAEWEYADRAGAAAYCQKGENPLTDTSHAWYGEPLANGSRPVGQKAPNAWGLYDMHGNVDEWVQDNYEESGAGAAAAGNLRVLRGGHWFNSPGFCGPGYRSGGRADSGGEFSGFRVVLEATR